MSSEKIQDNLMTDWWIDCYRLALDFGPTAVDKAVARVALNLTEEELSSPSVD